MYLKKASGALDPIKNENRIKDFVGTYVKLKLFFSNSMNRNRNFGLVFGWGKLLLTYRIVASTNTCYYSENQIFHFKVSNTLMSLIEEHARLDFSDFLSTLLAIFHVINKKSPPA